MKIENQFVLGHSPATVWAGLSDIHTVAECLPGASVSEALSDERYSGRFAVKLGPLAATFEGELQIERDPGTLSATVSGHGTDKRSSSRAQASLHYQIVSTASGHSEVQITTDFTLAGALAQFGKAVVIQQVANRITTEFVREFEQRLGSRKAEDDAQNASNTSANCEAPTPALDAGNLAVGLIRDVIQRWWRALFGRC